MAGERQPITPSARQVIEAPSAGHVRRYGAPRLVAHPSPGAMRQATAVSPAFTAPRQAAPAAMIARELGAVRAGQVKQPAVAVAFKRKHAELCAEAAGVALELGGDVCIYVAAHDGTRGYCQKFPGRPGHQQAAATITQLVRKDVAGMGLEEAKAHETRLLVLRAALVGKLHETEMARAAAAARPNKIIRLE